MGVKWVAIAEDIDEISDVIAIGDVVILVDEIQQVTIIDKETAGSIV